MEALRFAVCTTNYNCEHALERHLSSVYDALSGLPFEYAVVDNRSRDRSMLILRRWARDHGNFRLLEKRCTMGTGRNLAVSITTAPFIVIVDTDVVYRRETRIFLNRCASEYPDVGVQAIFLGVFPRSLWNLVGGRRSLNTYEDADFWMRLHAKGQMRWYPVAMGQNFKDPGSEGGFDHFSARYSKGERLLRLLRRQWDLRKTREYDGTELVRIIRRNTVDFGLGPLVDDWVANRPRMHSGQKLRSFGRFLFQTLRG